MKKLKQLIYLLAFLTVCSKAHSQVNSTMAVGWDSNGRAIAFWSVGYQKSVFNLNGEIRPSLSRSSFSHNYIGFRAAINLIYPDAQEMTGLSILPGVGYFFDMKSQDKTNLNHYYWAYCLRTHIKVTDDGALTFDGIYLNKSLQLSIGMTVLFHNRDHL
jgi:hypothetical protein